VKVIVLESGQAAQTERAERAEALAAGRQNLIEALKQEAPKPERDRLLVQLGEMRASMVRFRDLEARQRERAERAESESADRRRWAESAERRAERAEAEVSRLRRRLGVAP
jgi:hypothetical protein